MKSKSQIININNKIPTLIMVFLVVLFFGCNNKKSKTGNSKILFEHEEKIGTERAEEIAVEKPPFSEGIFPCNECHSYMDSNPIRRELVDMHDEISANFTHDNENRWCLDCHDNNNRDSLRLASGKLLDFKESFKLCGQCHGDKLRDWRVGVHGKRTGEWNGNKNYLLCVHCHDPHSPKFKEITPEPPPFMQEDLK